MKNQKVIFLLVAVALVAIYIEHENRSEDLPVFDPNIYVLPNSSSSDIEPPFYPDETELFA